jgi:hypothetical protein
MGLFDGTTPTDLMAAVERARESRRKSMLRTNAFYAFGKMEGRVVVAVGYNEAKHAAAKLGASGGIALAHWNALRSLRIPAKVRCVSVICAPPDIGEARAAARRIARDGIAARVKVRKTAPSRETRDNMNGGSGA